MNLISATPQFRFEVGADDRRVVREIVESTGYFSAAESDVAVELVDERLAKGLASGYHFVFLELDGRCVGYACYGPIACTVHSYDLYWIAVHRDCQRHGFGQRLVAICEEEIGRLRGRRIYVETSGREQYRSTRQFYERCHYELAARLPDFYDEGDDKLVYVKSVVPDSSGPPLP